MKSNSNTTTTDSNPSYKLKEESQAWVVTTFEGAEMEIQTRDINPCHYNDRRAYWIERDGRTDVLAVDTFTEAEKILMELETAHGVCSFEEAEEEFEEAEITEDRPNPN